MDQRIDLHRLWGLLLIVLLVVAASAGTAFLISNASTKVYTAQAQVVVNAGLGIDGSGTDSVLTAPRLGQTYAVLATTRQVLVEVIDLLGLPYTPEELLNQLTVTANLDTPFITIEMTDPVPSVASTTANAVATAMIEMGTIPATETTPGQEILSVVQRAIPPEDPSAPRVLFNTVLAAVAGLVGALVIIVLVAYVRNERTELEGPRAG